MHLSYKLLVLTIMVSIIISCTKTKEIPLTYRGSEPRIILVKDKDTITNEIGTKVEMPINFVANGINTIVIKKQIDNGVDSTIFSGTSADLPSDIFYTYNLNYINPKADTLDKKIKYSFTLTDKAGANATKTFTITSLGVDATSFILNNGDTQAWKVLFNSTSNVFSDTVTFSKSPKYYAISGESFFPMIWEAKDKSAILFKGYNPINSIPGKKIICIIYSGGIQKDYDLLEKVSSNQIRLTKLYPPDAASMALEPVTPPTYAILEPIIN